jgi:hypothetical protein
MVFDQNMIIDATRGSIARFINHSCEPNCKMVKWTVAGKPRMALFAGERGVMTGEELTYDYNFELVILKNAVGTDILIFLLAPSQVRTSKNADVALLVVGGCWVPSWVPSPQNERLPRSRT